MGLLRSANDETKKLPLMIPAVPAEDGTVGEPTDSGDWVEVKKDVSKRAFKRIVEVMPENVTSDTQLTTAQALQFQQQLFEILVVGWSLDIAPSVDAYLDQPVDASNAIDTALSEYFASLTPGADDATKSKGLG